MLEHISAVVLADNEGSNRTPGEWGLSIYIDTGRERILLDAGASDLFAANAEKLGCSVADVDYAVLSHAHWDHGNGMPYFFELNDRASLYVRRQIGENCYHRRHMFFNEYIGIPKGLLKRYADRIFYAEGNVRLCEDIWLIPHHTPQLGRIGKREKMYIRTANGWRADDFSHEQSLVFDTVRGLIIFNSCCHGGAVNIIREVSEAFPQKKVYALIGGLHLFNKSNNEVRAFAASLRGAGIGHIYTGHCTKEKAFSLLQEELGSIVCPFSVGCLMEF